MGENPYGCPHATEAEYEIGAKAIEQYTKRLIFGQHAKNIAYRVLSAVRSHHFEWERTHQTEEPKDV